MYTVKLLNNVRGKDELEKILNKSGRECEENYETLARINLALQYKEKHVNYKFLSFLYINNNLVYC
jgi:hypothetical protein